MKKPMRESSHARHMTAEENLKAITFGEWKTKLKEVHREASGRFKLQNS